MRRPAIPRFPAPPSWARQPLTLLRRGVAEFRDDHCPQMAAAVAFHVLFAVFPLAILAIGITGLVTQDPQTRDSVIGAVIRVVPLNAKGTRQLHELLASAGGGASALGLLGLAGAVWSASGMMSAIRTALNIAWDTDAKRPFVRGKLLDLALIAGTLLTTGATLGLTVASGFIRNSAGRLPQAVRELTPAAVTAARVAVVVISVALLFATFAFLYRFVPAVPTRLSGIWPGALTAAVGLEALQYGFSLYISFFANYNKVYGSLGAIVAFMFFSYLAAMVFLFGAEIASEYPRMRAEQGNPGRG